jgi:hypothetical protein
MLIGCSAEGAFKPLVVQSCVSLSSQTLSEVIGSRAVFRAYEASFDRKAWRRTLIVPSFPQRFTGTVADGGSTSPSTITAGHCDAVLRSGIRKSRTRSRAMMGEGRDARQRMCHGCHLWSQRYDRERADVFAVQDDIARPIVVALELRLSERRRHEHRIHRPCPHMTPTSRAVITCIK